MFTRRKFLAGAGAGVAAVAMGAAGRRPARGGEGGPPPELVNLSEHLLVYRGAINVGVVRDGEKALLIDCGDGRVAEALAAAGITAVDQVIFTHHHRDQACGAYALAAKGAKLGVLASERDWFDKVDAYWNNPKNRWHNYSQHPHHLMLAEQCPRGRYVVPVDLTYAGRELPQFTEAIVTV